MKSHSKRFYVTPLYTTSFGFDTVDLVSGVMKERIVDFRMVSKMPFFRVYLSSNKKKQLPLGNFTHNFDKTINAKVFYKKEHIVSKLRKTPKHACVNGWQDIADKVYLGRLEDLNAVYKKKSGLCQVYDIDGSLKTTLVVKNQRTKKIAHPRKIKLLKRSDGTEVMFYKDENLTWRNTTNEPIKFSKTESGYGLLLENGNTESYNDYGKLFQIKSDDTVYDLSYNKHDKLIRIDDNFENTMTLSYKQEKGLLKKVTYFDGTTVQYKYKQRKLKKVIYPDGKIEEYHYEGKNLTEVIKNNILQRIYSYDKDGKITKLSGIKESNPKTIRYDIDGTTVEENGIVTDYTFIVTNSQAKLHTVGDDEGIISYTYDEKGHPLSVTDQIGVTRITRYSEDGLLLEDKEAVNTQVETIIQREYSSTSKKLMKITNTDTIVYYVYDDDEKRLTYEVKTLLDDNDAVTQNKIKHFTYNDEDMVLKIENNGIEQILKYNRKGNVVETKNNLGLKEKIMEYNQANLALISIDTDGIVTKNSYDVAGRKLSITKGGKITKMTYDTVGRLIERVSENGIISYYKYDDFGNIIESSESTGEKNIYTFDAQNNLIQTQRYKEEVLVYSEKKSYDEKLRLISQTDAYGNITKYIYNEVGQKIEKINADGSVVRYEYNEVGKLSKMINPLGEETSYSYDRQGHTIKVITPNGAIFNYEYDGFGRLVSEENPDKGMTTYTYDALDRLLTTTDIKGDTKTNEYDTLGQLIAIHYNDSSLDTYYVYDDKSEIVKITDASGSINFEYDTDNLLKKSQTIDTQTFIIQNTYTNTDKLDTRIYPSGMKLSYSYNSKSELQSLYVNDSLIIDNIKFKNGQLYGYSYANGSMHERHYDLAGRITYLGYPNYDESIEYNSVDAMVTIVSTSQDKHYSYDFTGRLISYENNQSEDQKFSYDPNGNRLSLNDSVNGLEQYVYIENTNILKQLTRTLSGVLEQQQDYIYDEIGNIIDDGLHTYKYDARHRLVGVGTNIVYEYNSNKERVSKTIDGVKTYFIYDGHKLLGEYDEEGNVLREYSYLGDIPIAMLEEGKVYYIYADYLNTPRRVAADNDVILWSWESGPYGKELPTGSMVFNLRFPGQYYDVETGLHYNINRDYNPITGRYIQSDPVGLQGGVNTFAYAEANPVMKKDEMGLWASKSFWKVHQKVNGIIFGNTWMKRVFDKATVDVDRLQKGYHSYLHAMRYTRHTLNYAVTLTRNHIRNYMNRAVYYYNRGDLGRSYVAFGWALHTIQDGTSPAHKYFQSWSGNESYWEQYKHARKEWSVPHRNHELFRLTSQAYAKFRGRVYRARGHNLPTGPSRPRRNR